MRPHGQSLLLLLPNYDVCAAGDLALLEQVKQLIPRLTYQQIQDNPFADGVSADVSEDAQDIVPLVIDTILGFCRSQLCDFTSAFAHGTRMMKGVIEVLRIGLLARGDPVGIAQVRISDSVVEKLSCEGMKHFLVNIPCSVQIFCLKAACCKGA